MARCLVVIAALLVGAAVGYKTAERSARENARLANLEWKVTHYPPSGDPVVYDVHYDAKIRDHFDGSVSWMHYAGYRIRLQGAYTVEPRYAD